MLSLTAKGARHQRHACSTSCDCAVCSRGSLCTSARAADGTHALTMVAGIRHDRVGITI